MIRLLLAAVLLVLGYWGLLFVTQRRIAFPAPALGDAPPKPPDARAIWLESDAGRTEAWLLPPLARGGEPAPVLLFTHGNAELIDYWPEAFTEPRRWGMAVVLVEYPGYGRSGGHPGLSSFRAVMNAAYDRVAKEPGLDGQRIVVYGRSLGGAAAAMLAASRKPAGLILESCFTTSVALARGMGAPSFLVRDRFDNVGWVAAYPGPKLILHGEHDEVIPVAHGRALAEAARVPLRLMPCGHNDCPRPWPEIGAFLAEHGLRPDRRSP